MKRFFLCLAVIGALASCKKYNGPEPTPPPPPPAGGSGTVAVTEVGQTTGAAITKVIGAGGGTITSADGKVSLTIPAGALDANQNISMQPIQNKAPHGMSGKAYRFLPHGLQFKKPATISLAYNDADVMGSLPEFVGVATQQENKSWKKLSNIIVDKTAKTVKGDVNHFSDYSYFESFILYDNRTKSDTGVIHINTTEEVMLAVNRLDDWGDGLVVPQPAGEARNWAVNGKVNPTTDEGVGYLGGKNGYLNCQRDYIAPRRAPKPDTIAISVELDLPGKGKFWLVRTVVVHDINKMVINGKLYPNAIPTAIAYAPNGFLALGGQERMPNGKIAVVSVTIEQLFNAAPGTYTFNGSDKVNILVSDEFGHDWSSEKTLIPSGIKQYTGTLECTVTGTGASRYITGKVSGTFFGTAGTQGDAPAEFTFSVILQ